MAAVYSNPITASTSLYNDLKEAATVATTALSDSDPPTEDEEEAVISTSPADEDEAVISQSPADEDTILSPSQTVPLPSLHATRIISSPYPQTANQLDVTHLDLQSRLLSLALTQLRPVREDYATAPYLESFNWPAVFELLRDLCARSSHAWQRQDFYLVIFRSKLHPSADRERLGLLDQKSHEEACASGGLLRYWFGRPGSDWRNLATCIWRNREDASLGGRGPWHPKARGTAREMYEDISFYTHRFVVEEGGLSWHLEDFAQR